MSLRPEGATTCLIHDKRAKCSSRCFSLGNIGVITSIVYGHLVASVNEIISQISTFELIIKLQKNWFIIMIFLL